MRTKEKDGMKDGKVNWKAIDKRQYAWARLNLDDGAEGAMKAWNLFPIETKAEDWLKDYKDLKKSLNEKRPSGDDEKHLATPTTEATDGSRPISAALSTVPFKGAGQPPATSGASPTPTSTGDASRTSSPDNPERIPAVD